MNTSHRPNPEFVDSLERELRLTIRRQGRFDNGPPARAVGIQKLRWTTALVALAALCLGSAATLAVTNRLRSRTADLIIARSRAHLEFANARLELFREKSRKTESRAVSGLLAPAEVDSMRFEFAQVEADAAARALDVEEVQISGRDPDNALSAPLLRGRDFVTERLELQRSVLLERVALIDKQASGREPDAQESSEAAPAQEAARAALATVERHLALRQDFLSGACTARRVELAGMQVSLEPQRESAARRVQELQEQLDRFHALFEAGLVSRSEVRAIEMQFRAAVWQCDSAELEIKIIDRKLADPSQP